MTATFEQARDSMLALISLAWGPTMLPMVWDDLPSTLPSGNKAWARTVVRHEAGRQSTLGNHEGVRRYRRQGSIFVQIFTPAGEGLSRLDGLAKIVHDALEGKTTSRGVEFSNTRLNEVGRDGNWHQTNVVADFRYDEIK
jgi:hypothetical protein